MPEILETGSSGGYPFVRNIENILDVAILISYDSLIRFIV